MCFCFIINVIYRVTLTCCRRFVILLSCVVLCYYMLCCVVFLCCAVLCCVSCIVLRNSVCVALRLRELFGRAFKHLVLRQIF